ncbi:hypothetical protein [Galbibacter sp. BG1]
MNKEDLKKELAEKAIIENSDVKSLEVIFREGHAKTVFNKEPVEISGTIDSPRRFIEKREKYFESKHSHCLVSKSKGTIQLVINEQDPENRYKITGSIHLSEIYKTLGINTDKSYEPRELSNKFKLLRSIFKNRSEHLEIVSSLRNLKAKVNQELDQKDDQRGNRVDNFSQTVQGNIPKSFNITIPLIEGEDKYSIELSVTLEVEGSNQIICFLESIDAAELIDKITEERIEEEIEAIKDMTTVIFQ